VNLNSDIQALIDTAKQDFEKIKNEYQKSLHDEEISSSLRISIKNCLENIRSSLDFLGYQISEENCPNKNSKIYFPIFFSDKQSFDKFMTKTYPNLKNNNSGLYSQIESIQYYINPSENEWMKDLVILVNENKHRKLTPQTKTQRKQLNISSGGAGISLSGGASIKLGGGASIRMGGKTIYGGQTISPDNPFIHADPGLNVERKIWVDFKFDELKKSVLPTLSKIIDGAQKTVDKFKN